MITCMILARGYDGFYCDFKPTLRDASTPRGLTGFGALKTGMGSGEMRPMTSVRAAGYSSRGRTPAASGQGTIDPFVSPSNSMV
jgi:hypothetical protein